MVEMQQQKMTMVSQRLFDYAVSEEMSFQEAVSCLEKEAKVRSFREKMQKYAPEKDLRAILVDGLTQNDPGRKKDSVERLVRGWLNTDKTSTISKEDAIELCFILELPYDRAEEFVLAVSEEGFHWRDPGEIAYIFALRNGLSFQEARLLKEKLLSLSKPRQEESASLPDSFTSMIRNEIYELRTEEELLDYVRQSSDRLGSFHNTAYDYFMTWMERLKNPQDELLERAAVFEREKLSIKDILREYMFQDIVMDSKKEDAAKEEGVKKVVRKYVRKNWPNEASLSKMSNRQIDVTRKVLILLFLATEEEPDDYEEPDEESLFEDLYQRLNDMLASCGFSALDPRSPFDWLIIYCMCVQDIFDIDSRLKGVFEKMFGEQLYS